jgi:large subunit ribosomal protein L2
MGIRAEQTFRPERRTHARERVLRKTQRVTRKSTAGRNASGQVTVRHRGGGHKRRLRTLQYGGPARYGIIQALAYDPGRSAPLFVVAPNVAPQRRVFVLGVAGRQVGDARQPYVPDGSRSPGARGALSDRLKGTQRHGIELREGAGRQLVRAAGTFATVVSQTASGVRVRLPSGEERRFDGALRATLGVVGGVTRKHMAPGRRGAGKAGRSRWLGMRPKVRGVARNPVDHPHGGGQGKTKGGRPSVTAWSKARGTRTSSGRNLPFLVRARRKGQGSGR